ncbi:MAG TPA: hypothetical protein VGN34_27605 [Ktedonobacteraceae bacterium]
MALDPQRAYPRSGECMSVEEYFQLDYMQPNLKYEYQDGAVRLMSGASGEHDTYASLFPAFARNGNIEEVGAAGETAVQLDKKVNFTV